MEFLYPQFFLIFFPPLIWLVYILVTKKRAEQDIFSKEVLKKLTSSVGGFSTRVRTILALISLLLMVVALARPVESSGEIAVESTKTDIVIAIDISKSMLAKDIYPNRIEFAKLKILELLQKIGKNRVGVVAFANSSYTVSPLTFDKRGVSYLVRNLDSKNISQQGTSIKNLISSVDLFLKENRDRVLLVLSDGGDSFDYSEEIEMAKESGLKIFVLGIGTELGGPIELEDGTYLEDSGKIVVTKFNYAIKDLAFDTDGVFVSSVNSNSDVELLLNEIENLESSDSKSENVPLYKEYFIFPLIASLLFLFPVLFSLPRMKFLYILPLLFVPKAEAGLLDWWYLDKAENSFNSGNYQEARDFWKEVDNSDEVSFNIGNSYYREGNYSEAVQNYKTVSGDLKQNALFNSGNSYVKMEKLLQAKELYEKALELGEKPNIRENLEWVKRQLKKENQDEKQKDSKENSNSQEENQEENSNSQEEDSEKKQDSKETKESENESKEKSEESEEDSEKKGDSENIDSKKSETGEKSEEEREDVVQKRSEGEVVEEREVNESQFVEMAGEEMLENGENREEMKIFQILNETQGGTKVYSIPINRSREENLKPW